MVSYFSATDCLRSFEAVYDSPEGTNLITRSSSSRSEVCLPLVHRKTLLSNRFALEIVSSVRSSRKMGIVRSAMVLQPTSGV